jgi:chromate transporter
MAPPRLFQLFWTFFRIGLTGFGGPSMIADIRRASVEKHAWVASRNFLEAVAFCQMIPGALAMQTAAYVGLQTRGPVGAIVSFIAFGLPAFLLMLFLAALYARNHDIPGVIVIFEGLQAVIVAIIANATVTFGQSSIRNWKHGLMAATAALLYIFHVNPVVVVLIAASSGLFLCRAQPPTPTALPITSIHRPAWSRLGWLLIGLGVIWSVMFWFKPALAQMSLLFFRLDLMAFGGGFASVPLMLHEIVEVRHWLGSEVFMHGIVLGQITPGPIVMTATFVGYMLHGLTGGIIATISILSPSLLLVIFLCPYFEVLRASPLVSKMVTGVLCSFVGLLLAVTIHFADNVNWNLAHLSLALAAFVALRAKIDVFWVVMSGTGISAMLYWLG